MLQPLSSVLHSAIHLLRGVCPRNHANAAKLHWLPICECIAIKISLLMYNLYSGTSSPYMTFMVMLSSVSNFNGLQPSLGGDFTVLHTNR